MNRIRTRLTYANVASTIALFLALTGGVVYAAEQLGSKDIAKNAIKSKHVKDDNLTGADVNEGTLTLPPGPQGPPGPKGDEGERGDQGIPGNSAPADGPGVVTGKITNPSGQASCLVGAPSGLSATAPCAVASGPEVEMPLPAGRVVRNVRAQLSAARPGQAIFAFLRHDSNSADCAIPAGELSCTIPGPIAIPPGARYHIEYLETDSVEAPIGFSYEVWSATATP